jgi:hypothetical protein
MRDIWLVVHRDLRGTTAVHAAMDFVAVISSMNREAAVCPLGSREWPVILLASIARRLHAA